MACNAIDIYRAHPECFDRETYTRVVEDDEDLFTPPGFTLVRKTESSIQLNYLTEPHIIIAASGMAEGSDPPSPQARCGRRAEHGSLVGFAAEHHARQTPHGRREGCAHLRETTE